jgi:hypothetical protein
MALRSKLIHAAFDAVDGDELGTLRELLEEDPSLVDATDHRHDSLLHRAAAAGNLQIMGFLVDLGVDVNVSRKRIDGISTPLHEAARKNQIGAVNWLVENGAEVDAGFNQNGTPLIGAAIGGHLESVSRLVELGADINASYEVETVDGGSVTLNAIKAAGLKGLSNVTEFLVKSGATENGNSEQDADDQLPARDESKA